MGSQIGNIDPSDEAILYMISFLDGKINGVVVNSYGVYCDDMTDDLMEKFK